MTDHSDAELVKRFQQGDQAAFANLVQRWDRSLLRVAYRITGELAEAEDVRQTVFLRVLESPQTLRQPHQFASWIYRTTINQAISTLRQRKRQQATSNRLQHEHEIVEAQQPYAAMTAADEAEQLSSAMAQLQPAERAMLALRFDEGLTFREIALTLELPPSTVKSRFARTVQGLRDFLGVLSADRPNHE